MSGIWKNIPLGTLLFTNSFNSAKSVLRFDGSLLRNISKMDENYSFSFAAISSDNFSMFSHQVGLLMTRATSVIDNCGRLNKIRGKM